MLTVSTPSVVLVQNAVCPLMLRLLVGFLAISYAGETPTSIFKCVVSANTESEKLKHKHTAAKTIANTLLKTIKITSLRLI